MNASVCQKVCPYHFLGAAFGQSVAVAQVVDLDILDVVAILLIDLVVKAVGACRGRLDRSRRLSLLGASAKLRLPCPHL